METVFKVGDRVYDITFGWGTVMEVLSDVVNYPITVKFENCFSRENDYTLDGKLYKECTFPTLSFTEYTLDGFTQKRPIELPEPGEEIMVSDDNKLWELRIFKSYEPKDYQPIKVSTDYSYKYFKRLR